MAYASFTPALALTATLVAGCASGRSVRTIGLSDSLPYAYPRQNVGVSGISAQGIVARIEVKVDQPRRPRLVGSLERFESLVHIAERPVSHREVLGSDV